MIHRGNYSHFINEQTLKHTIVSQINFISIILSQRKGLKKKIQKKNSSTVTQRKSLKGPKYYALKVFGVFLYTMMSHFIGFVLHTSRFIFASGKL